MLALIGIVCIICGFGSLKNNAGLGFILIVVGGGLLTAIAGIG